MWVFGLAKYPYSIQAPKTSWNVVTDEGFLHQGVETFSAWVFLPRMLFLNVNYND